MDLNEVPSDHMVIEEKMDGENNMANFDTSNNSCSEESRINVGEVEKRCRDVEEKCLALQIRDKDMELEEIRENIRVLEGERVKIEKEVKGLRKKKANIKGTEIIDAVAGESLLDEGNFYRESDEESKIDQLMIENKVLECEKNIAIKEVEEWKRKCKDFELRVRELEEWLRCQSKDGNFNGVKEDNKDVNVGGLSIFSLVTSSPAAVDGGIQIEGTSSMEKQVKRQFAFCYQRSCDQKIAPSTPAGARLSVALIDIDSDHEHDVSPDHGLCLQSDVSPSVMQGVGVSGTSGAANEEDDIVSEGSDTLVKTPKRKRDLTVVTSDDELGENEVVPRRRALKIDNSDNEGEDEDDDALPIKQIFNGVESNCQSDDEDNIPISQLKMNRAESSRKSARLQERNTSGQISDDRPRRRLVKCGQSAQSDTTQKMKISSDSLTKKYVEDDESEEDDSRSNDSLSDFIVDDTDVEDVEDLEDDLLEDGNHHSYEHEEPTDDNLGFEDIISRLQRRKDPNSEWVLQGDMLSDFGKNPELCMRAVCALHRRQTTKEMLWMDSINQIGQGFSKFDAPRGTVLGEFLTDGDPNGGLVKTVEELQIYDPEGPEVCRSLAVRYSNQLFEIYKNREYPFFP